MAVSQTRNVNSGDFIPYHTERRGEPDGLVGVCSKDAEATGAAGGGTVSIIIQARRDIFGFPWTWVPTAIVIEDNLAAAEEVEVTHSADGNRVLGASLRESVLTVRTGSNNHGVKSVVAIPVEPSLEDNTAIILATWPTNTDGKTYHLHVFGPVFDMQWLARNGNISPMLAGLR